MSDILSQEELDALLAQVRSQDDSDEEQHEPELGPLSTAAPPMREAKSGSYGVAHAVGDPSLNLILAIPLELSVELGRTRMSVHELLQLGQGSVIELDRMATDLIDLTVHGRVIATGEAVVVNESFGFRVAEVDSVQQRINKL
ncbi:MAG: flagellar motor switch protein FliN [Myxococcales bacterium]|nr:flagellar motor switch protein FliN [Myxococcales bacterium]